MEWYRDLDGLTAFDDRAVWTIGTYDGIHLGHREILGHVRRSAQALGQPGAVLCFDPPAWKILGSGRHPYLVISTEDRRELLAAMGLDRVVCLPFSPELLSMTPGAFADELLWSRLRPAELWVGHDFRYGYERRGDVDHLRRFMSEREVPVRVVSPRMADGVVASSTEVRARVLDGDLAGAARILGRPHFLRGRIVTGDGRGRTIGFPTANLEPVTELVPPSGVYAATLEEIGGSSYEGLTNIGFRPTFEARTLAIETFLFDADRDFYERDVRLHLHWRVRDERRFSNVEALVGQIRRDVEEAVSRRPFPPVGPEQWG
jgi:riboflavin kinase/FMN adenylyltransferase